MTAAQEQALRDLEVIASDFRTLALDAALTEAVTTIKAERARYRDALRKIAEWKGYTEFEGELENDFERGANDMLETLATVAKEALA